MDTNDYLNNPIRNYLIHGLKNVTYWPGGSLFLEDETLRVGVDPSGPLVRLCIERTRLDVVPQEVFQATSLTYLTLINTMITELPRKSVISHV